LPLARTHVALSSYLWYNPLTSIPLLYKPADTRYLITDRLHYQENRALAGRDYLSVKHMEAVETVYDGRVFRSRTEALWAALFDALKVPYEHEPQAFQIDPDVWYLPDFWLPEQETWVEIKGDAPTPLERSKAVGLYEATTKNVFVFCGFPELMQFTDRLDSGRYVKERCNFGLYTVGKSTGGQCRQWAAGSLTEKMLRVLGMAQKDENEEQFRGNVARLARAVRLANDCFHKPEAASQVFPRWIAGLIRQGRDSHR